MSTSRRLRTLTTVDIKTWVRFRVWMYRERRDVDDGVLGRGKSPDDSLEAAALGEDCSGARECCGHFWDCWELAY